MEIKNRVGAIKSAIIIILAFLLLIAKCSSDSNDTASLKKEAASDTIKLKADTVVKVKYVKVPYPVYKRGRVIRKDSIIYEKTVEYANIDSSLLLSKYYAKSVFIGEIVVDPGYTSVIVIDSVSRNKIYSKQFVIKTIKKRNNNTNVLVVEDKVKTREWYAGAGTSVSRYGFNTMHGSLLLKNKRDEIYQLSAGITNTSPLGVFEPFVGATVLFKIK